jgi:hypothetical protein
VPFNAWFREVMKEVHGVDISQPGPPATQVLDVQLQIQHNMSTTSFAPFDIAA